MVARREPVAEPTHPRQGRHLKTFPVVLDEQFHVETFRPWRRSELRRNPNRDPRGKRCGSRIWWADWHEARRGQHRHGAQDIFGPQGARIVSMGDGSVRVGVSTKGGNWVRVRGRFGVLYYSHLDSVAVEDGARVSAGDMLGRLGRTGNAARTCPHLHISWRPQGRQANLDPYLRALRGGRAVDPTPPPVTGGRCPHCHRRVTCK